jgi:hypothetical protein
MLLILNKQKKLQPKISQRYSVRGAGAGLSGLWKLFCPCKPLYLKRWYMNRFLLILLTASLSGCIIVPDRASVSMDKVIELDERALENAKLNFRLEWVR